MKTFTKTSHLCIAIGALLLACSNDSDSATSDSKGGGGSGGTAGAPVACRTKLDGTCEVDAGCRSFGAWVADPSRACVVFKEKVACLSSDPHRKAYDPPSCYFLRPGDGPTIQAWISVLPAPGDDPTLEKCPDSRGPTCP